MTQRGENSIILKSQYHAGMMELADMRDLGSRAAMRWGSSPHARTSVGAKSVRLRFRQQPTAIAENCAHFLAPPSKSEALGFGFVFLSSSAKSAQLRFRQQPTAIAENCAHYLAPPSKSEALGFGFVFFGLRIVRDGIEHLGTIGTNKPATAPQMRCRCRFCPRRRIVTQESYTVCQGRRGSPC